MADFSGRNPRRSHAHVSTNAPRPHDADITPPPATSATLTGQWPMQGFSPIGESDTTQPWQTPEAGSFRTPMPPLSFRPTDQQVYALAEKTGLTPDYVRFDFQYIQDAHWAAEQQRIALEKSRLNKGFDQTDDGRLRPVADLLAADLEGRSTGAPHRMSSTAPAEHNAFEKSEINTLYNQLMQNTEELTHLVKSGKLPEPVKDRIMQNAVRFQKLLDPAFTQNAFARIIDGEDAAKVTNELAGTAYAKIHASKILMDTPGVWAGVVKRARNAIAGVGYLQQRNAPDGQTAHPEIERMLAEDASAIIELANWLTSFDFVDDAPPEMARARAFNESVADESLKALPKLMEIFGNMNKRAKKVSAATGPLLKYFNIMADAGSAGHEAKKRMGDENSQFGAAWKAAIIGFGEAKAGVPVFDREAIFENISKPSGSMEIAAGSPPLGFIHKQGISTPTVHSPIKTPSETPSGIFQATREIRFSPAALQLQETGSDKVEEITLGIGSNRHLAIKTRHLKEYLIENGADADDALKLLTDKNIYGEMGSNTLIDAQTLAKLVRTSHGRFFLENIFVLPDTD